VVKIAETTVSTWTELQTLILTPLGFIIFFSILVAIAIFIIVAIKNREAIKRRINLSQFKENEKLAMYSKGEWQNHITFSAILMILIGGFIVSCILYVITPITYPSKELFRNITLIFGILVIPGVPLVGWRHGILYRTIKKRYKKYLSEKDFILATLGKEIVPCFSNPEIEAKFDEIGFENGQGKKIFKLLSGAIIEEHY
jgi:magnesium-transporting ATPase (P-type)